MAYDLWGFAAKCPYYGVEKSKCLSCGADEPIVTMQFEDKALKTAYRKKYCDGYEYDKCGMYAYLYDMEGNAAMRKGRDERFTEALRECGYTQRALADELGMSEATLSRKMNGERTMTLQEALHIEALIGLSPDEIARIIGGK